MFSGFGKACGGWKLEPPKPQPLRTSPPPLPPHLLQQASPHPKRHIGSAVALGQHGSQDVLRGGGGGEWGRASPGCAIATRARTHTLRVCPLALRREWAPPRPNSRKQRGAKKLKPPQTATASPKQPRPAPNGLKHPQPPSRLPPKKQPHPAPPPLARLHRGEVDAVPLDHARPRDLPEALGVGGGAKHALGGAEGLGGGGVSGVWFC